MAFAVLLLPAIKREGVAGHLYLIKSAAAARYIQYFSTKEYVIILISTL